MSPKNALVVRPSSLPAKGKSFTLALGGGAARGFAHIPIVEALNELGVKPDLIVGTSMGSIIGSCYAAGMTGVEIRDHTLELYRSPTNLIKRLIKKWPDRITDIWNPLTPSLFDPVTLFEMAAPDQIKTRFEDLKIPFKVITTDFYAEKQRIIDKGPVIPAIAASSALPALFKPVEIDGDILVDGGFVNPTPFDIAKIPGAISIAVDVTGGTGHREGNERPGSLETWVGSTQIMLHSITREKLKSEQPDILIRPAVELYGALEFQKVEEILAACEPAKDELKRALENKIEISAAS